MPLNIPLMILGAVVANGLYLIFKPESASLETQDKGKGNENQTAIGTDPVHGDHIGGGNSPGGQGIAKAASDLIDPEPPDNPQTEVNNDADEVNPDDGRDDHRDSGGDLPGSAGKEPADG